MSESRRSEAAGAAGGGRRDVIICGLHVRSDIDLPGWVSAPAGPSDVRIEEEAIWTPTFEGAAFTSHAAYEEGEVRAEIRGVGRFAASASRIRVSPEAGAKPEDVRLYATGAMFGALLHQRGVFPLHASCVAIDGAGVAFAGASGSGKSTLVAAMLRRGAQLVSDDISALASDGAGGYGVWPCASHVKLDRAGMSALERAPEEVEPAGGDRGKYHVRVAASTEALSPVPLSHVFLLGFGNGAVRTERLGGLDAISALVDEAYVLPVAVALGLSGQVFRIAADAARTVAVSRLLRPRGLEHLDAVVDRIEGEVRQPVGPRANDGAGAAPA